MREAISEALKDAIRSRDKGREDLKNGYITKKQARDVYGLKV